MFPSSGLLSGALGWKRNRTERLSCSGVAVSPLLGKLVAINTNQEETKEWFFKKGLQTGRLYFFK